MPRRITCNYLYINMYPLYIYTHVGCRVQELGFREIRGPLGGYKGS